MTTAITMDDVIDELTRDSNAVIDLVHEGKLDEAEQAAHAHTERTQVNCGRDPSCADECAALGKSVGRLS